MFIKARGVEIYLDNSKHASLANSNPVAETAKSVRLSKIWRPVAYLALSLLPAGFAPAQPVPAATLLYAPIAGAPKEADATNDAMQEWRRNTLKIVRKLEASSRQGTTSKAYKEQLTETTKELNVALKDAPDDIFTFGVRNAVWHYQQASELLQFVDESNDSAYLYRQKADGLLQMYVGKYKKVSKADKLSERYADLVDAPLAQIWKEASDFLIQAQEWIDIVNRGG